MGIGYQSRSTTFDASKVKKAVEAGAPGALSKAGAYVYTRATRSLKPANSKHAASSPGQPPRIHGKSPLKSLTKFAVDKSKMSVVIGPEAFSAGAAPTIEGGGSETVKSHGKQIRATYAPRPWMGPALQNEIAAGTLPSAWEGMMKHG